MVWLAADGRRDESDLTVPGSRGLSRILPLRMGAVYAHTRGEARHEPLGNGAVASRGKMLAEEEDLSRNLNNPSIGRVPHTEQLLQRSDSLKNIMIELEVLDINVNSSKSHRSNGLANGCNRPICKFYL